MVYLLILSRSRASPTSAQLQYLDELEAEYREAMASGNRILDQDLPRANAELKPVRAPGGWRQLSSSAVRPFLPSSRVLNSVWTVWRTSGLASPWPSMLRRIRARKGLADGKKIQNVHTKTPTRDA